MNVLDAAIYVLHNGEIRKSRAERALLKRTIAELRPPSPEEDEAPSIIPAEPLVEDKATPRRQSADLLSAGLKLLPGPVERRPGKAKIFLIPPGKNMRVRTSAEGILLEPPPENPGDPFPFEAEDFLFFLYPGGAFLIPSVILGNELRELREWHADVSPKPVNMLRLFFGDGPGIECGYARHWAKYRIGDPEPRGGTTATSEGLGPRADSRRA
jgi:hypothetical protein